MLNHDKNKGAIDKRLCSNCKQHKNSQTGGMLVLEGGLRQKWICASCWDKRARL
jgi:hypothetical protein